MTADKTTDPRVTIARQNIRIAAALRDMTQTEVARRAGLNRNAVSQFTSGRTKLTYENMLKICDVLDVPIGAIHRPDSITTERLRLHRILERIPEHMAGRALSIAQEWASDTNGGAG